MDPKDRVARRDRLRARAVTTTVVATVVAAPVLALWAAYRGTPVGEGLGGGPSSAREDGTVDFDGEGGAGYENAGNAEPRPRTRFDAEGEPDVSVEVVEVTGAGHKGAAALGVTAAHSGDTTLITLTARGEGPVRWSASTGASWLYLNRSSGILAPGESVTIRVFVDQLREPSGHWRATVVISPAGSVVSIEGTAPRRPPRHRLPVGPGHPERPAPVALAPHADDADALGPHAHRPAVLLGPGPRALDGRPHPERPDPHRSVALGPRAPGAQRLHARRAGHPGPGDVVRHEKAPAPDSGDGRLSTPGETRQDGSAGCGASSGSCDASRSSHSSARRSYPALPISSISSAR